MRTFLYWLDVCSPGELAVLAGYIALCAAAYLACGLALRGRPAIKTVLAVLAGLIASLALCALSWDGLYFRTGEFRSTFPEGFLPLLLLPAALALALGVEYLIAKTRKEHSMENENNLPEISTFSPFDWLAVVLGIALSALWFHVFSLESLLNVPGLGTTAFVLGALGAECLYLRRRIRPTGRGLLLVACTVLLAVSCGLFGDYGMRMINLALLAFLTPASALALAGRDFPALELRVVPETFRLFFPNLFVHFLAPFRALRRKKRSFKGFWTVVLTLMFAVPVLAVILALLMSADQVFSGLLGDAAEGFLKFLDRGWFLVRWVRIAVLGLMLFSFLYSLARPTEARKAPAPDPVVLPCLPCAAVLVVLDLLYAVFAAVQFVYLFGGTETVSMQGGYAQYARQGFFQLVAVAGINLLAAFTAARASGKGKRAVNVLLWLLLALTAVILASAATRMCLYIGAYGLSLLRAMTLLVMLWIALALLLAGYKTLRPDKRVFPALFAAFLILWTAFSLSNIDARIAHFNRAAHERGLIAEYDAAYIERLAPSEEEYEGMPWGTG